MDIDWHTITVTIPTTFEGAMAYAATLYDEAHTDMHIVVTSAEPNVIDGVFCEGCDGHTVPGVRWPTAPSGDTSREWVERCDTCQRYPDDDAAAQAVVDKYGDPLLARVEHEDHTPYIVGEVAE